MDRAFEGILLPLLGLIFLPWTTFLYVLVYNPVEGVSFLGWVFVVIGLLVDIGSYTAGAQAPLLMQPAVDRPIGEGAEARRTGARFGVDRCSRWTRPR